MQQFQNSVTVTITNSRVLSAYGLAAIWCSSYSDMLTVDTLSFQNSERSPMGFMGPPKANGACVYTLVHQLGQYAASGIQKDDEMSSQPMLPFLNFGKCTVFRRGLTRLVITCQYINSLWRLPLI